MKPKVAVTGAYGYTGKYIARLLLGAGHEVITLTAHPERSLPEFSGRIKAHLFNFDHPDALRASLSEVTTLYNTYYVRFDHDATTHAQAVANTRVLIRAAQEAGVQRIVHVSITNPSLESSLPYFRGKAQIEEEILQSGLSYAILRPTVIYGAEDILINNIAWLLRHFPVFAIPGSGEYCLQPIFVEDMAALTAAAGEHGGNEVRDAVGPDSLSFNELFALIAKTVHSPSLPLHVPVEMALILSQIIGAFLGDVVLTRDEVVGLSTGLLVSSHPPAATTRLADWLEANKDRVGLHYASELKRHY